MGGCLKTSQDSHSTGQGLTLSWTWFPTASVEQAGKQLPPKTYRQTHPAAQPPYPSQHFRNPSKAFSVLCLAAGLAISQALGAPAPNLWYPMTEHSTSLAMLSRQLQGLCTHHPCTHLLPPSLRLSPLTWTLPWWLLPLSPSSWSATHLWSQRLAQGGREQGGGDPLCRWENRCHKRRPSEAGRGT